MINFITHAKNKMILVFTFLLFIFTLNIIKSLFKTKLDLNIDKIDIYNQIAFFYFLTIFHKKLWMI